MSITIELPAEIEADLRAEAAEGGRPVEELLAEAIAERYTRARREAQEVLNGSFHSLTEAGTKRRAKLGIQDLSHLSREELTTHADTALANLSLENRKEAERLGLL